MFDYKDIYETEDLPEAEQDYEEDNKDCVEKLNITVSAAFNRFKGKEISLKEVNKSKSVRNDNPYERARKILSDLENLSKEIQENYDSNINNKSEPVTKEHLTMLIEGLSIQVKELDLNKYFGPEISFEIKDPNKVLYKKVIQNIDELTTEDNSKKSEEQSNNPSYVITNNTEVNEHISQLKIANFHKRLDVLEKVLGDDNIKLSNVVNECPNKGLIEAVERLFAKTSLLNNPQLNVIESRLTAVINKLQHLTTVASNADKLDQESQIKIAELYEIVKKWDHMMDAVPNIIDQCISMQDFHSKSIKLGQCISLLDTKHQQMHFKQQNSQMALKNIQNNLAHNFQVMEKNITIINEKLKSSS